MATRADAFAALKRLFPGIWNKPGTIREMNEVMDAAGIPESAIKPTPPSPPERPDLPSRTGPRGIALIKRFEGCARLRDDGMVEAYPDPGTGGEPWTIGWGNTMIDGRKVKRGMVITRAQADTAFVEELKRYERDVVNALGSAIHSTSQAQFDALVSFHYNTGAIGKATLTRKHKAGDYAGAAREFARWNRAGGRVLKGLTRRRADEAELYRKGS